MALKVSFSLKAFAILTLASSVATPLQAGALFRYRSYLTTPPVSNSPVTAAGNISHAAAPNGDVISTARGSGFTAFNATDFDGASEYIGATSAISTKPSGSSNDSYFMEAIFNPRATDGQITLVSNTQNVHGFSLKIYNGRLRGYARFNNSGKAVSILLDQDLNTPAITLNAWHRAIFQVQRQSSSNRYNLQLYLDGNQVAQVYTTSLYSGVYQCSEPPMVGAEPDGGVGTTEFFNGLIHQAVISQGTLPQEYLTANTPRDGTSALGFPTFLEHLNSTKDGTQKMADTIARYPAFKAKLAGALLNPLLNDSYVPQGLATDGTDNFFVSYYWRTASGNTGDYGSIVSQVGFDGQLRRVFELLKPDGTATAAHTGGCTWYAGDLYVAIGGSVYRYDLANLPNPSYIINGQTYTNIRADMNRIRPYKTYPNLDMKGNNTVSFIEVGPGGGTGTYAWIGQYDTDSDRRLLGYLISPTGDIASNPSYNFKLFHRNCQGICAYKATGTQISFYLSQGGHIYAADYPLQATAENIIGSMRTVSSGPAGNEDLALVNGDVWTVSESGCLAYQTQANPWNDFFPFIYGVKGETSGIPDALSY